MSIDNMSLLPEVLYLADSRGRANNSNNSARESEQKPAVSSANDMPGYLSSKLTPRNTSSYFGHQRTSFQEIRLPNIDLNNSLNLQADSGPNRPRTVTLDYPTVLHTPPLQTNKGTTTTRSAFSEICHFCGKKFGSASILIHEKQCQKKLLLKHNKLDMQNKNQKMLNQAPQLLPLQGVSSGTNNDASANKGSSWGPFGSKCRYCGVKFGTHSIAIHEKRCTQKTNSLNDDSSLLNDTGSSEMNTLTTQTSSTGGELVARVVTVGLEPGKIECIHFYANKTSQSPPSRPKTRTLEQSALRSSGIKLPTATPHSSYTVKQSPPSILCENCGESVSPDRTTVHSRICKKSKSAPVTTKGINVTLPSLHNLLRTDQELESERLGVERVRRKPRTVVCYICGREYGRSSISIHEPQCMKKWEAENRKLPIRKRKPLPKKKEELTRITCVVQDRNSERLLRPLTGDLSADALMQEYFQHCYSEFEKELVPCKKCGRTFAPERHFMHEPNCNAKPLSSKK